MGVSLTIRGWWEKGGLLGGGELKGDKQKNNVDRKGGSGMRNAVNIGVWVLVVSLLMGVAVVGVACGGDEESTTTTEEQGTTETTGGDGETAATVSEEPFYAGKTIKILVGHAAGGGYDTYARMISQVMEKYLPGSTIIVKNVTGAGGIICANTLYNDTEPDGLTFGTFNSALPLGQVTGTEGVQYDLTKMSWLGSPATKVYSGVLSVDAPISTWEEFVEYEDELIFSSSGASSQATIVPNVIAQMFEKDNVIVPLGYDTPEGLMSMRRGETNGRFGSWDSMLQFVQDGYAEPFIFVGAKAPEGYDDVPLLKDVVEDEDWRPVSDALTAVNQVARPYVAPPGVPEDRLKVLRDAFEKTVKDPEFIELGEQLQRPVDYVSAEEAAAVMESVMGMADDKVQILKDASSAE